MAPIGESWRDVPDDPGLKQTARVGPHGPYVGAAWRRPRRFARHPGLEALLQTLSRAHGPQRWWPAETPFEVVVGAVLTQNTSWNNVELALGRLRALDVLSPARLVALEPDFLEEALRPSGTYRAKARKLAAVSRWYLRAGGLATLRTRPLDPLRAELLAVHGIGPETADAILCYALSRPVPIVDVYARRVLERHALVPVGLPYDSLRSWLVEALAPGLLVAQEFHALVVRTGASACKPVPRCDDCPLPTPS